MVSALFVSCACAYTHAAFGYSAANEMTPWWAETPPIARVRFLHRMVLAREVLARAAADKEEASLVAVLQDDGRGRNLYLIRTSDAPKAATVCACLWYEEGFNRHVALLRLREWWEESAVADESCCSRLSFEAQTTADGLEWTLAAS